MRAGSEGSGEGEGLSSLRAFAHSSSLHGISHVFAYGAVSLRRVLWGAFFLGSLGLLLLVCAERVAYFLTYPHVTKLDEVAAHNLTFPAITICNLNEFRFSKITRNDMYHVGELLALLNDRYEISNPQLAEPHVLAALRDKANFKNFKAKPFSMAEFYNRTGHDLADIRKAGASPGSVAGPLGPQRAASVRGLVTAPGVGRAPVSVSGSMISVEWEWVTCSAMAPAVPGLVDAARSPSGSAHVCHTAASSPMGGEKLRREQPRWPPAHAGHPAPAQPCLHLHSLQLCWLKIRS
uniref:Uncharacterized protein n=1 Tax=Strix occidentalis caurina TaxID=311401 RepID=A0A8D0ESS3_STROC